MPSESALSADVIGGAATTTGTGPFLLGIGCGCCGGPLDICVGCGIPQKNLTVDWTNTIFGNGSGTMTRIGVSAWTLNCGVSTVFAGYGIFCTNAWIFRVTGFGFGCGSPPTSTNDTTMAAPHRIISDVLTCGASFDWTSHITAASCPDLWSLGFTSWHVHL